MPPDPGVTFVLVVFSLIVLSGVAYLVLLIARWNSDRIRYVTPRVRSQPMTSGERYVSRGSNPLNPPEPAEEPGTEGFTLEPDELAAVARMIEHKATAEKATKASIIWAGFGIKKGASAKYQRASEIYDALFVIPPSVVLYPDPENGGRVPASYPVSGRRG